MIYIYIHTHIYIYIFIYLFVSIQGFGFGLKGLGVSKYPRKGPYFDNPSPVFTLLPSSSGAKWTVPLLQSACWGSMPVGRVSDDSRALGLRVTGFGSNILNHVPQGVEVQKSRYVKNMQTTVLFRVRDSGVRSGFRVLGDYKETMGL